MALKLHKLKKDYDLKIDGLIHVGIHWAEEHNSYIEMGIKKLLYFEADPDNYQICKTYIENTPSDFSVQLLNIALGDTNSTSILNISSNDSESSSFLKPKLHLSQYPWIEFSKQIEVQIKRLDDLLQNVELYNMMVIDVQGFELNVLKGSRNTLSNIDYIMTEINVEEMYENCCLVSDLDLYLSEFGFERVETDLCGQNWGDALYVKNKKVNKL